MEEKAEKILVAVDGSDNSERALIKAKRHGEQVGGEITILTVVDPISIGIYRYSELSKQDYDVLKSVGESILAESLNIIEDSTDKVTTKLKKGSPADEILKEAEDGEYDLIVMGSRGYGVFSKTILGSVSQKILNHTETDVLIIK